MHHPQVGVLEGLLVHVSGCRLAHQMSMGSSLTLEAGIVESRNLNHGVIIDACRWTFNTCFLAAVC